MSRVSTVFILTEYLKYTLTIKGDKCYDRKSIATLQKPVERSHNLDVLDRHYYLAFD